MLRIGILFFVIGINCHLFATDGKGYYVTLKNDTVHVKFKLPRNPLLYPGIYLPKLQKEVEFYTDNKEKRVLYPSQVLSYSFTYLNDDDDRETFSFVSKKNTLHLNATAFDSPDSSIFLNQVIKGKLSLYIFYGSSSSPVGNGISTGFVNIPTTTPILEKAGGELFWYNSWKFKDELSKYLFDCPSVVAKLQDKKFKNRNIKDAVSEYNTDCGN